MDFLLSEDLQAFGAELRKFLTGTEAAAARTRSTRAIDAAVTAPPFESNLWGQLAKLGMLGAAIPESAGGLGLGANAMQLVAEELTRALAPLPAIESSGYAASVLSVLPSSSSRDELLTAISGGDRRLSCSLPNFFQRGTGVTATKVEDGFELSGNLPFVSSRSHCTHLLIWANQGSPGFYVVHAAAPSIVGKALDTLDLIRCYEHLALNKVPAIQVSTIPDDAASRLISNRLLIVQSAELYACGVRALELTVEHAKTRTQFGAPIGSFQAVQHGLADMLVRVEQAGSLSRFAGWCVDNDTTQLDGAAVAAKGFASEWIPKVIEKAIQLHGGIGFTFEYELHFYLRRALVTAAMGPGAETCYTDLASSRIEQSSNLKNE